MDLVPKQGEMWRLRVGATVVRVENVYDDCLTYRYEGNLMATTLPDFLARYSPRPPTVVGTMYLYPEAMYTSGIRASYFNKGAAHAVQLMSDGDFRVVKL